MKKRIVFFQPPFIAGAMMCLKEQILEFKKLGYIISVVITNDYNQEIKDFFNETGVDVTFIKCYSWISLIKKRGIKYNTKLLLYHIYNITYASFILKKFFKQKVPDYVYCNSFDNYVPLLVAKKMKIKSIVHFHEFGIYDHDAWFVSEKYANKVFKSTSLNICISDAVKKFYEQKFPQLNFTRIYDGIESRLVDDSNSIPTSIKNIGIIGRITEGKGQFLVLQCAKRFPQYNFQIWGKLTNSKYEVKCKDFVEKNELKNVSFKGYNSDPKSIYKYIDAIIVPSRCEAFGRIVIEAMANKRLVIASKTGSFVELIENEIDGLLFDYNLDALVDVLNNLDSVDYNSIVENAYNKSKNFTSEINAKMISDMMINI